MMARTWRDYDAANQPPETCDNSDKSDKRGVSASPGAPNVPIVTNVTGLPADMRAGLLRLVNAPAPRLGHPELWPGVVADAVRLASEGWATQALSLGWSALDLFGAVTNPAGDPHCDGLAVKLDGRRVLAICATFATVAHADGGRSYLYRGDTEGARLLWALGRGR